MVEQVGDVKYYLGIADDPLASSAMNWTLEDQRYRVVALHCTDSRAEAYPYVPGPRW